MSSTSTRSRSSPCATILLRHIRKTGGTSVRELVAQDPTFEVTMHGPRLEKRFHGMNSDALLEQLTANDTFAMSHPRVLVEYHSPYYTHGSAFLEAMATRLPALRAAHRRRGCLLIALTLLREPADMIRSDFAFAQQKSARVLQNRTLAEHSALEFELQLRHLLLPRLKVNHFKLLPDAKGNVTAATAYAKRMYGPYFFAAPSTSVEVANAILSGFDLVGVTASLDALQARLAEMVDLRSAAGHRVRPLHRNKMQRRPLTIHDGPDDDEDESESTRETLAMHAPVTDRVYKYWAARWQESQAAAYTSGSSHAFEE